MKILSLAIILVSLTLGGCRTVRLADVLPEMQGTEMGSVSIGRENIDYFIIPEPDGEVLPFEFNVLSDEAVTSASSIVVFKTRDRHPVNRTFHQLGAPVRAFDQVTAAAYERAVAVAHSLVNRPGSKEEPSQPAIQPPFYPDTTSPKLRARPANPPSETGVERVAPELKNFANPAVTTAGLTKPQTNRHRG